ncbi:AtuA-related protein [Saccharopolyspora sp. NPDC000995]
MPGGTQGRGQGRHLDAVAVPLLGRGLDLLVREVSADRVRAHLADHIRGEVLRYELPDLCALQFTCRQALDGGVTTSLALDTHGKALSSRILPLDLRRPDG